MRIVHRMILTTWIGLALAGAAIAGPFEDGMAAQDRGDFAEAARAYRIAADQGTAEAQFNLGQFYYFGRGVAVDHAEALRWYRLAAAQGSAYAQTSIGLMYDEGTVVPKDPVEAVRWYRLAAAQGDEVAKAKLVGR